MMEFFRSMFGLNGSTGTRKVVGKSHHFDVKDVEHIRDSEASLTALYHLSKSYAGTVHEPKIKQVYEKTKNIHHYLVSRNRVHELALFHLRNTQHFISTFKSIIEVHQKHTEAPRQEQETRQKKTTVPPFEKRKQERKKIQIDIPDMAEMLINALGKKPMQEFFNGSDSGRRPGGFSGAGRSAHRSTYRTTTFNGKTAGRDTAVPEIFIPEITLLTYEKVPYQLQTPGGMLVKDIGYISTIKEKEAFVQHVSERLEIRNVSYLGNALLKILFEPEFGEEEIVPVIHWQNSLYALDLKDFRIFPVKMYRKSS